MSTTTMMRRPSLLSLVKEAMEGTASQVDINTEAMFQQENIEEAPPPQEKTASVDLPDVVPTEYVEKVAAALDFLSKQAEEGKNKLEPGKGPGALEVLEATSSEENVDVNMGQAKTQIPMKPPMTSSGVAKDPSNAMDENIDMSHPEQPVDPMGNEKTSAIYAKNLERLGLSKAASLGGALKSLAGKAAKAAKSSTGKAAIRGAKGGGAAGLAGGAAATGQLKRMAGSGLIGVAAKSPQAAKNILKGGAIGAAGGAAKGALGTAAGKRAVQRAAKGVAAKAKAVAGKFKKSSAPDDLLMRNLIHLGLVKEGEDAINPAKIAAGTTQTGATPPEGASASEEQVPSEPGDVTSQKSMISSNQAAIDYTKGKAKADPKSDVNKVLVEPALTSATDKVLQQTLDNTGKAGVKISQVRRDLTKTAAAQALLSKIAAEAEEEKKDKDKKNGKKEKESQMGAGLGTPAGQSGFQASNMGM
jgi:hypothetical protein